MHCRETLEVFPILTAAIRFILNNLRVFLMASVVPMIFLILLRYYDTQWYIELAQRVLGGPRTAEVFLSIWPLLNLVGTFAFLSVLAVAWHRLTILGTASLPNRWGMYIGKREIRFFGWSFLFGLAMMLGYVPFPFFMAKLGDLVNSESSQLLIAAYHFFPMILYIAVIARYGLVLPAVAIGKRPALKDSVELTQGHYWQLFLILSIPPLLVKLSGLLIHEVAGLSRFGSASIVVGAIWILIGVFEVVVLSICFQKLKGADIMQQTISDR